jgi:hypothetical protein
MLQKIWQFFHFVTRSAVTLRDLLNRFSFCFAVLLWYEKMFWAVLLCHSQYRFTKVLNSSSFCHSQYHYAKVLNSFSLCHSQYHYIANSFSFHSMYCYILQLFLLPVNLNHCPFFRVLHLPGNSNRKVHRLPSHKPTLRRNNRSLLSLATQSKKPVLNL